MTTVAVPTYKLNSGYEIPLFGVGTFLAPGNTINIMLKNAIACGYTHIDCAERYGNQKEIGATLKEIFAEGKVKRQDLFITSKVFVNNLLPECILQSAKTTLADLQLDYLDLLLIHWPLTFAPVPFPADSFNADGSPKVAKVGFHVVWKAMEDLVRVHKLVRSIGVSNFGVQLLNDVLSYAEIPPATNQVEVHPFFQQSNLIEFCFNNHILVTAYSPLAHPDPTQERLKKIVVFENPVLLAVAKKHGRTVAQVVLRWGLQRRGRSHWDDKVVHRYDNVALIPKGTSLAHLQENIGIFDFALDDADIDQIATLDGAGRFGNPVPLFHIPVFD